jgi:uncharacterized iron-regulated membrane protein
MKLAPRSFTIFWDVHAWAGVLSALLLYVIFFMGAFALFHRQLDGWAEPGRPATELRNLPPLQPLLEQLGREEPLPGMRRIAFLIEPDGLSVSTQRGGRDEHGYRFSAESGRLEPRHSQLGTFLYEMHYLGPLPGGVYIAGVAALGLLLALLTGSLIHWKDLRRQWFQFRPERVARTWSSDMHKVLGVFGLPYQLFYAWSGVMLSLSFATIEPVFVAAVFHGDRAAAASAKGDPGEPPPATGRLTGALPNLDLLVARASSAVPGLVPNWVAIEHVGDEASSVSISGDFPEVPFGSASVLFRASDGGLLRRSGPATATWLQRFEAWFYGLHYAQLGGAGIRSLYALLAFATCAVIATGNLVWLERRAPRPAQLGNRVLQRLTVGCCAGVVPAVAALFLANRLIPTASNDFASVEQSVFWSVWGAAALAPFVWRTNRCVAALELWIAAGTFTLAFALDALTRWSRVSAPLGQGVAVALLGFAFVCAAGGFGLWRPRAAVMRPDALGSDGAPLVDAE